jgi:nucleoside-diphosphate-sugar epimerase
LCERLLAEGAEVICVDNYFTGSRRNIAHLLSKPLFEAMRHDVTFPLHVEVDAIFNLACPASPIHYQRDPVQTTKTSVHGAINMPQDDPRQRQPDLSKAKTKLDWQPKVALDDGLKETIAYFKRTLGAAKSAWTILIVIRKSDISMTSRRTERSELLVILDCEIDPVLHVGGPPLAKIDRLPSGPPRCR